jgi:hypothetical protein
MYADVKYISMKSILLILHLRDNKRLNIFVSISAQKNKHPDFIRVLV